jgi:hypothetical protein
VFDLHSGTITLSGLTVEAGKNSQGAGINVSASANVTLTDVVVQNNLGNGPSKGGGIFNAGNLTLRNVIVQNNGDSSSGDTQGAGIYIDTNGILDARDVEIRGNNANGADGGGLYMPNAGAIQLANVTFAQNHASNGGGLWLQGDGTSLVNVTISGNSATGQGGGLWAQNQVALDHVTVAYNSATSNNGGGVFDNGGYISTANSLFAHNTGGNANRSLLSLGYNLSDDTSAGFAGTGDLSNLAVVMSPLANNGGFTRTHAIGPASAARDSANPVTSLSDDQRGTPYLGRADIGAFEYNPFGQKPTVSAIGNQSVNEDTTLGSIAFTVGDDGGAAGLAISASSSNTALVPNGNISIGGSGANRAVTIVPASNANSSESGGPATITLFVSDGVGGNVTTTAFTVTVLAVNDPPTISLPVAQTMLEDGTLTLSGANAPVISDVDAGSAPVQITLAVTQGLLTLSQTTGLSFVSGNGSNNASMTLNGSLASINAALAGLQYRPGANYNGPDRIDLTVNDLGNSGSGGAKVTSASLNITVSAVNDAPVLYLPGAQGTAQFGVLPFSNASGNAITFNDVDAGSGALDFTLDLVGVGALRLGSTTGLTVTGAVAGDTHFVLHGTQADLNSALDTLGFSSTTMGAARIDMSVNDLGNTGAGGALLDSGSVVITVSSDPPPTLGPPSPGVSVIENDPPAFIYPAATVADNGAIFSARVQIASGYAGSQDVLGFISNPGTTGNIVGSYSAGVLTLSSAAQSATQAQWSAALQAVTYTNTSDAPATAPRSVRFSVNDGISDSAAQFVTINVTAVNDAPVLNGANDLAPIAEDDVHNSGTLVSTLIAGHITDVDSGAVSGVAVTHADNSNGSWQYSTDGGVNWTGIGAVSDSHALLLGVDAATAIRFVPASNFNGGVVGQLLFRAWDQSSGSASSYADASVHGATTAFSNFTAGSDLVVTAVNDAPVLTGANNLTTIAEGATGGAGTLVSTLIAGRVSDVDGPSTGIAVTGVDGSQGVWQYTLDGGNTWLAFGTVGDGSARLLAADANTAVRLLPGASLTGSFSAGLTFRAWDGSSGTAGSTADASANGADTAFSSTNANSGITVTAVNHAPVLANSIAGQVARQDVAFSFQLPTATFTDIDVGDTLTYTAGLAGGGGLPAWLSFDATQRTFSGIPGSANVGDIVLHVVVADGAGATASGDFTLSVAHVNPAPVLANIVNAQQTATATQLLFQLPAVPTPEVQTTSLSPVMQQLQAPIAAAVSPVSAGSTAPRSDPDSAPVQPGTNGVGLYIAPVSITIDTPPLPEAPRSGAADASSARLGSRADAVLADAMVPQFGNISVTSLNQLLRGDELTRKFEELQRQMQSQGNEFRGLTVGSSILVTGGVSIGYVVWLVRGGVLMSSMLSALPAWQMIDPLPVLAASRGGKSGRKGARSEDAQVEKLFDEGKRPRAPVAPSPQAAGKVGTDAAGNSAASAAGAAKDHA